MFCPFSEEQINRTTSVFDSLLTDADIPVAGYAFSVLKDGKIAYEHQNGFRRIDPENPANNLPMERDTKYRIASISKVFTAIAIMQLADHGLINIDGDISEYLGFKLRNPNYPNSIITARQLMSHISSIRDGSAYAIPVMTHIKECFIQDGSYYGNGEHFAAPEDGKDRGPGKYFLYSNLNFGILGTVIERLSGQRFDEYMREHVLLPMGINASYNVGDFNEEEIHNVAVLYKRIRDGEWDPRGEWCAQMDDYQDIVQPRDVISINNPDLGISNYEESIADYEIGTNGTIFSPQGGLRISAHELALMAEMLMNKGVATNGMRILSEEAVKQMETVVWFYDPAKDNCDMTNFTRSYGTGLVFISDRLGGDYLVEGLDGLTYCGHTGSAYGLVSACFFDPDKKQGFAYAFNGLGSRTDVYGNKRTIWHRIAMEAIYRNMLDV